VCAGRRRCFTADADIEYRIMPGPPQRFAGRDHFVAFMLAGLAAGRPPADARLAGPAVAHTSAPPDIEWSSGAPRLTGHATVVARFPDLIDTVQGRTWGQLAEALADRIARLSLTGRIRRCDPACAAEQFLALLTGPIETRSRMGTREIPADEMRAVSAAAADTFLRAYASES
jgi:hypothetical protein